MNRLIITSLTSLLLLSSSGCITINTQQPQTTAPPSSSTIQEPPPVITLFEAQPAEIAAGQTATLLWEVTGATHIEINQDIGTVAKSGNLPVVPQERTVYTITASSSGGSVTAHTVVEVNKNLHAKDISLTIKEMEDRHFLFLMSSEPSVKGTISTYYIEFAIDNLGERMIDNTIYVYDTTEEAERVYSEDKNNSRMYVTSFIAIGTQGYYMEHISNPDNPPTYALRFQKNNVYVKMVSTLSFAELEEFARIVADRIY